MGAQSRRAFTLIEIIAVLVVFGILSIAVFKSYSLYYESSVREKSLEKFREAVAKASKVLSSEERAFDLTCFRNGVRSPKAATLDESSILFKTFDAIKPSDGIDEWRAVPSPDDPDRRDAAKEFWKLETDAFRNGSSFYIAVWKEFTSRTPRGTLYPYKTVTLIDFGPFYRNFKKAAIGGGGKEKEIISSLFAITKNGSFKIPNPDLSDADVKEALITVTGIRDGEKAKREWLKNSALVHIASIFSDETIRKMTTESEKKTDFLKKTVEDWAVNEARIAAYETVSSGNNYDKDYFVTCYDASGTGGDNGCETVYVNESGGFVGGNYDYGRTFATTFEANVIDSSTGVPDASKMGETSKYGFFLCKPASGGGCSSGVPYGFSKDRPYSKIEGVVEGEGVWMSVDDERNPSFVVNPGMLSILRSSGERNPFGLPFFFTSAPAASLRSPFVDSVGGDAELVIRNVAPLKEVPSRPPYTASVGTLFPWFVGGYENVDSSGSTTLSVRDADGDPFGVVLLKTYTRMF